MSDFFKELQKKSYQETSADLDQRIIHLVRVKAEHAKIKRKKTLTWGIGLLATLSLTIVIVNKTMNEKEVMWNENPEMLTHMQEIEFFMETEDLLDEDWQEAGVRS